jgi:cell division transport system permease protein
MAREEDGSNGGAVSGTNEGRRIARAPEPRPADTIGKSVLLSRHRPEIHARRPIDERAYDDPIPEEEEVVAEPSPVVGPDRPAAVEEKSWPPEPPPIDFHDLDLIRDELDLEQPLDLTEPAIGHRGDRDRQQPQAYASRPAEIHTETRIDPPVRRVPTATKASQPPSGRTPAAPPQQGLNPVVPPQSVAGRALMLVVGIMCFLACLAVGALVLVEEAAHDWQLDVSREVTVQVKPVDGKPIEASLQAAMDLARATKGVRNVRLMSERDSEDLLEPWLGSGFDYSKLPVPRLILIDLADPTSTDLRGLQAQLAASVPNAELDDHSIWAKRLRTMAGTMVAASVVVLVLVLTAMVLSVVFATRAAMAGNRDVVQVLHFVGAEDSFIAGEFQHHFLILGFKGGVGGGIGAMLAFLIANWLTEETQGMPGSDQAHALFGGFAVGMNGYLGAAGIVLLVAGLTALTSRLTVRSYLNQLD